MSIKEIYEYAKVNGVENMELGIYDMSNNKYMLKSIGINYTKEQPLVPTNVSLYVETSNGNKQFIDSIEESEQISDVPVSKE